ncbi:MAG: UDP-3-O-(3-hydroxymyristoyl)glucosamine N-acyltransferase [Bacteroidales bacterium]|nr:UDP-3-O-(3-hydroxymyristoyl)glucosamine N-acyltransferase [Bacteroidales bacterium]
MKITAREIAAHLNGDIIGDADVQVSSPARIEYGKKGNICFLANPKYEKYLYTTDAGIVLVNRSFSPREKVSATMIAVDDAYAAVAELLEWFSSLKKSRRRGSWFSNLLRRSVIKGRIGRGTYVGQFSVIERRARIGRDCQIYPQVFIGENVIIGDNVIIYPGARIYHDCVIGNNCILHAGCVIGADGFGFAPLEDGTYQKIQQTGNVVLEDNVEVGANACIDRATMGSTIVRRGVKLDDLVMIAHNVEVGANTVMAGMSGVAGSAQIGEHCVIGGQCGIGGHIKIADHTTFAAKTGLMTDWKTPGQSLMGYPAMTYMQYMRAYSAFKKSGDATHN